MHSEEIFEIFASESVANLLLENEEPVYLEELVKETTEKFFLRILYKKTNALLAGAPLFSLLRICNKEIMSKDLGVEYDPGAIKFYKEMGTWSR